MCLKDENNEQKKSVKGTQKKEKPKKSWIEYTLAEKRAYLEDNLDKTDCEFLIGSRNCKAPKSLRSFKWILSDISPMFKKMFKEQHSKTIRIRNVTPADFEHFLSFIHIQESAMKSAVSLLAIYDVAKKYMLNMHDLRQTIMGIVEQDWQSMRFALFVLAYARDDKNLKTAFEKLISAKNDFHLPPNDQNKKLITELSTKVLVKLIKLQLLYKSPTTAANILHVYLQTKSKKISNLDKDILHEIVNNIIIPPNAYTSQYTSMLQSIKARLSRN